MNKIIRNIIIFCLIFLGLSANAETDIGELVKTMSEGQWKELKTLNLHNTIANTGGASGHILTYSNEGKWDSSTQKVYFIGGDHNGGAERFVSYSAESNTWKIEPRPNWMDSSENQNHSYDYQSMDNVNGNYYFFNYKYNTKTKVWSELSTANFPQWHRGTVGFEYFEGQGLMAFGGNGIYKFDESMNSWQELEYAYSTWELHPIGEYNPVHKVLMTCIGDNNNDTYLRRADGSSMQTSTNPIGRFSSSSKGAAITVDPVSGDFLSLDNNGKFFSYNPISNVWKLLPTTIPQLLTEGRATNDIILVPISTYGVVMAVQYDFDGKSRTWIYKHSKSSGQPPIIIDVTAPKTPQNLMVK